MVIGYAAWATQAQACTTAGEIGGSGEHAWGHPSSRASPLPPCPRAKEGITVMAPTLPPGLDTPQNSRQGEGSRQTWARQTWSGRGEGGGAELDLKRWGGSGESGARPREGSNKEWLGGPDMGLHPYCLPHQS